MRFSKRGMAIVLCVMMCVQLLPQHIFAEESSGIVSESFIEDSGTYEEELPEDSGEDSVTEGFIEEESLEDSALDEELPDESNVSEEESPEESVPTDESSEEPAIPAEESVDESSVSVEESKEESVDESSVPVEESKEESADESSVPVEESKEESVDESSAPAEESIGENSEEPSDPALDEPEATFVEKKGLRAVQLYGPAAMKAEEAEKAIASQDGLDKEEIDSIKKDLYVGNDLFVNPDDKKADDGKKGPSRGDDAGEEGFPSSGDGSTIESITARWITEDTVDNGVDGFLYVRPNGDTPFSVRLQINYALSGEHPYEPGDVTITIPANIFKTRSGKEAGTVIIPYPEDPSTKQDFNWKLVGNNYILTNTRRMSAATKGYIQIGFDQLVPHDLVDMQVSDKFDAYIEVVTHKGNTIALRSDKLTAQFDTEAKLNDTSKRVYGSPSRVPASEIPESQRVEGETEYIKVEWYVWGATSANTLYTMGYTDTIPDEYNGFIIGSTSEDGRTLTKEAAYNGYSNGQTSYYYFSTAYPASQFEPDVTYTFHNNVEMTVTERDPAAEVTNPNVQAEDPKLVTTKSASAQVNWSYTNPEWHDPTGHFMVAKNGNDGTDKSNNTHHRYYSGSYSDLHIWANRSYIDGWYGIYPSALNDMREGEDILFSYTIDSVGYVMPWMFDSTSFSVDGEVASRLSRNYNRPVTMVTEDTGVSIGRNGEKLAVFDDYVFVSLEFPREPWVYTGIPQNINPDGSWVALTAGDGTFKYTRDNDYTHFPEFTVELLRGGEWAEYATVSWTSGSAAITLADGSAVSGSSLPLPEDTENFRIRVTLQNTSADEEANLALQAALDYDIRPVIRLIDTDAMKALVEEAFENSNTPEMFIYNSVNMKAYEDNAVNEIVSIDKDGYDSLRGYTTDTMVYPYKESKQTISDVNYETRQITIHYSARIEERSVISERDTWEQAVSDGRLDAQTGGTWYDLLPKGATPVLSTIKLRTGDTLLDAYTVEDYKGSGRTLLVVKVKLTPVPERYREGDMYYYQDVPSIGFDALYGMDSLTDYGDYLHNVISYESDNDILGTVPKYSGEADNPTGDGNVSTSKAFENNKEKGYMTNLDPDRDTPSFVYAGDWTKIDIVSAARVSLSKDVMTNNDGTWSEGTYYGNPEENKRTVYEGGVYTYRLRMMPDADTIAKDLIVYDSLENFYAGDGNDTIDIDAPHWHGRLISVDVSQLTEKGCAPVVYYSTVPNLILSDGTDPQAANTTNTNLNNTNVWVKASEYPGELADVKAVAVDASRKADGNDFRLEPLESIVILINLQAPDGEDARNYIAQKGDWGDSAMAYNNAYLSGTTIDKETQEEDSAGFVRKDYTKVGLTEYRYEVIKVWDDDNDRDGVRPESITLHLYADGKDTGKTLTLPIKNENGSLSWKGSFENIPYTDPEGNKILYSVREDVPAGYTSAYKLNGNEIVTLTNKHEPELTRLDGEKKWIGDTEDARPESITVRLLGDGAFVKSLTVRPDEQGNWTYSFEDLLKYRNHGVEIVYTVEEVMNGELLSYIPSVDGNDLINTYHPYGDLVVRKFVTGTTDVSKEQYFTFTFTFSKTVEGETVPVFNEYAYEVLDEEGEVISEGTVSNNGTVQIKGGQTIHVKDVDEYVNYTVTEAEKDGFELTGSVGTDGTIKPNEMMQAEFTNEYSAKGQINLTAEKLLHNRELQRYQFRFEVYQVTVNEDGSETETQIRTGCNISCGCCLRCDKIYTGRSWQNLHLSH